MVVELERRRLYQDQIIHSGTRIKEVGFGVFILADQKCGRGPAGLVGPRASGQLVLNLLLSDVNCELSDRRAIFPAHGGGQLVNY